MNDKLKPLHEDPDARRWADEFFMAYNNNLKPDYDWMVTWFSNSIMCGYDNGYRKALEKAKVLVDCLKKIQLQYQSYSGDTDQDIEKALAKFEAEK